MTKAEIGDLIVFSARSQFSTMTFGIVYGFDKHDIPMVQVEDVHWKTRERFIKKQVASKNYLVISRPDDRIQSALAWRRSMQDNS